ncbi:MAG: hypothetical protein Q9180_004556 [Flavoplaca navasiana]
MPSCPRHPQIYDQPCTCPPPPAQTDFDSTALTIFATIFNIFAFFMLRSLIDNNSHPRLITSVGFLMLVTVIVQMVVFHWVWDSRTKDHEKCTKTAPKKEKRLKKEDRPLPVLDGCGSECDSPPDYLEVDGEFEAPKDDRAKTEELEACVRCLVRLMGER